MADKKYYDTFYGNKVSDYGLERGYVDYHALAECFEGVLCNKIAEADPCLFDSIESGDFDENTEIFQYFIVSDNALEVLKEADEIVFYSPLLDCYVWGVTHYGTSWDYVLTSIKLKEREG